MSFSSAFITAVDHEMLYEVGGFWNVNAPGVSDGSNARACGYVNDPTDPGGETKFGIAKNDNPDLDVANLDWAAAQRVYYRRYWLQAHCDLLDAFASRLAALHFDSAINHGVGRSAKFLQGTVGVSADGDIGPATIAAAQAMDPIAACNALCDTRAAFYKAIVANKPEQGKYLNGWLRRIEEMRAFTTNPANFS